MSADFRMSSGWYEPPVFHDCDDAECRCVERAADMFEDAAIARAEMEAGR